MGHGQGEEGTHTYTHTAHGTETEGWASPLISTWSVSSLLSQEQWALRRKPLISSMRRGEPQCEGVAHQPLGKKAGRRKPAALSLTLLQQLSALLPLPPPSGLSSNVTSSKRPCVMRAPLPLTHHFIFPTALTLRVPGIWLFISLIVLSGEQDAWGQGSLLSCSLQGLACNDKNKPLLSAGGYTECQACSKTLWAGSPFTLTKATISQKRVPRHTSSL